MGDALDAFQPRGQKVVGLGLDPLGDIAVGRAAIGRVVLEATALRWVMRRRDDDAIGQATAAPTVVANDRVGHRRRRRVLVILGQHDFNAIGRQHLQGTGRSRCRQRMGIGANEQRTIDALGLTVQADRLADGQDVILVEAQVQRAAAVPGGAERDALAGNAGIGLAGVIGGQQARDIHQHGGWSRFACQRTELHAKPQERMFRVFKMRSLLAL
ncbi:hypothetical protein D3C72_1722460 [compost metagenome]